MFIRYGMTCGCMLGGSHPSSKQKAVKKDKKVMDCVLYTGRGAKPSGVHTPKQFLATTRDLDTKYMCKVASNGPKKMTMYTKKDEKWMVNVPTCPKPNDVIGWMKWSGASQCKPSDREALKKEKRGKRS